MAETCIFKRVLVKASIEFLHFLNLIYYTCLLCILYLLYLCVFLCFTRLLQFNTFLSDLVAIDLYTKELLCRQKNECRNFSELTLTTADSKIGGHQQICPPQDIDSIILLQSTLTFFLHQQLHPRIQKVIFTLVPIKKKNVKAKKYFPPTQNCDCDVAQDIKPRHLYSQTSQCTKCTIDKHCFPRIVSIHSCKPSVSNNNALQFASSKSKNSPSFSKIQIFVTKSSCFMKLRCYADSANTSSNLSMLREIHILPLPDILL